MQQHRISLQPIFSYIFNKHVCNNTATDMYAPQQTCMQQHRNAPQQTFFSFHIRDSGRFLDATTPQRSATDIYAPFWEYAAKVLKERCVGIVLLVLYNKALFKKKKMNSPH